MKTKSIAAPSLKHLQFLPDFAAYILESRITEFAARQIEIAREYDLPLLQYLDHLNEEQLLAFASEISSEFLGLLAANRADEHIELTLKRWTENELPQIGKHEIQAEDINLFVYVRKKTFLHFVPAYCQNVEQVIELVAELDLYSMRSELASTNLFIDILKERINENAHLIERVNNTIPGAIYVYDLVAEKGVYANNKLPAIIGYTQEELDSEKNSVNRFIHPEDVALLLKHQQELLSAKDGDIISYHYRIRNKDNQYIWLRNYESVFKRKEDGSVSQKIGITININREQLIAADLYESQERYKQAEAITHIGNYNWNFKTNEIAWSDELYKIHELDPGVGKLSLETVRDFNHPDDQAMCRQEISDAISAKKDFDFYYRVVVPGGKIKILHARGHIVTDKDGNVDRIIGTSQDVTEKQNLIGTLREKESLYKQAEELANMGNWKWDIKQDRLDWTDQLYRIYGLEPQQEKITIDRFISLVHPEDRPFVQEEISKIFEKERLDYSFRILSADNTIKVLRCVAQLMRDKNGEPETVIGSERDITEKQNLIDRLKKSENLYKQAQALAHVGNWTWDIKSNLIHWSDELFRIYGMEPQSEALSYERYLEIIHPDDRDKVTGQVQHAAQSGESWEFVHRLVTPSGEIRIVNATGEVLKDKNGEPFMMLGTAQDITERQMLINRLQESETLYKQAQSLARIGNWSLDVETKKFTWSDEMYRIYELDKNEGFDIDRWLSYLDEDEREKVMAYYLECLREKKLYDRVQKINLPNGKVKMIHRKGEFILNEKGEPVKMIGTTQDITEEYRVQHELKENQTFIRKITDATPSIIASYNINTGRYVFISEGLEKLLGYDPREVMEQGIGFIANLVHPEDAITINEKNLKALEEANSDPDKNDMVVEFTYRMRHINGQYRWFHTYGTIFDRNSDNKVEHVLNISLDVTDQMEASKKIKEQEHFIKQIADASPTILYLYDVETQSVVYVNREIFFVLGYMPEEMIEEGADITALLYHPEDYHLLPGRKQSGKTFQQVDSMIQYECRMKNKEGEWRWLLVREIVFSTGADGKIKQILGAALDINRRKEMEKTILQNTLLLEQSNASLEEFAYVASHDLKEPLRKISTFGDRLVATQIDKLAPDGKLYLQKIVDASQRMQTMINDLLSISMITGNTSFEKFSLQKILEETLQTLEFKIEQMNAVVLADQLPEANIIASQFRQLFQNLMSNSLKFVREGVQPEIKIKHTLLNNLDTIHYHLAQADQYHKIEFIDNGIGFEKEFAGKIFAIFQRLHGRSEYEGSGIGLAICKKIVEHHGGIIYAESEPGHGAKFTIVLPA